MSRPRLTAALLILSLAAGGPAAADQTDPRLAQLFTDLRTAPDAAAARAIEAQIWALWGETADDAAKQLMEGGTDRLAVGDIEGALAVFDRLVARFPRFAEGWNKRATTLYLLNRPAESIADIDRVLALEPRHFGAISGLAMCDELLGKTREALDALRRAQAIDPQLHDIDRSIDALKKQLERESI